MAHDVTRTKEGLKVEIARLAPSVMDTTPFGLGPDLGDDGAWFPRVLRTLG
ncbi:MAG: hypothetical protein RL015_1889 [Verrucomicrobiota bacterium]|jgi:hypothetical protein